MIDSSEEGWAQVQDPTLRKRIQNKLAQRRYRQRTKDRQLLRGATEDNSETCSIRKSQAHVPSKSNSNDAEEDGDGGRARMTREVFRGHGRGLSPARSLISINLDPLELPSSCVVPSQDHDPHHRAHMVEFSAPSLWTILGEESREMELSGQRLGKQAGWDEMQQRFRPAANHQISMPSTSTSPSPSPPAPRLEATGRSAVKRPASNKLVAPGRLERSIQALRSEGFPTVSTFVLQYYLEMFATTPQLGSQQIAVRDARIEELDSILSQISTDLRQAQNDK